MVWNWYERNWSYNYFDKNLLNVKMAIAVFPKKAQSNSKKIMKEKVVQIYERFFQVSQFGSLHYRLFCSSVIKYIYLKILLFFLANT